MTARADIRFILFSLLLGQASVGQVPHAIRVPQDYRTIQSAINSARSGDTVLVDHGTYYENVRINKNIVVGSRLVLDRDTSHISRTIIDGSKPRDKRYASTIKIFGNTDSSCVLTGFTIRRGTGSDVYIPDDLYTTRWIGGGGILLMHAGATIADNIVTENVLSSRSWSTSTFGAGIAAAETSKGRHLPPRLLIERNVVVRNTSTGEWAEAAGIGIYQPGIVRHNVVTDNRVISPSRSPGGGIVLGFSADYDIIVDGNDIRRNVAGIGGGMLISGAFVRRGRAIVTNNIIANNEAFEVGGACNVVEESFAIFINNTIVGNKANSSGGGINVTVGAHATLVNNILWHNSTDQVSIWGYVQAHDNLVEGGIPGWDNIDEDPGFLRDDSLFRLSPNSPALGTGTAALQLVNQSLPMPFLDMVGSPRNAPPGAAPDLGAREMPFGPGARAERIIDDRADLRAAVVKLTIMFRQISPLERRPGTQEITRAGSMRTTIVVNDTGGHVFVGNDHGLQFTLPAGQNLLELELLGRGRDSLRSLNVFYRLVGVDSRTWVLSKRRGFMFHSYSDLKPGTYLLEVRPQDDDEIIGHTNRLTISIFVTPYWYERWWAYALYGIAVVVLAFVSVRIRVRRVQLTNNLRVKELESQKLADIDRLKSRFFANLSHEFRTPLSLILGPADQLESAESDAQKKEQLGTIRRNADRLLRMVNLLLQFARIESGTLKLHVALQPIPPLIRRAVSSFATSATKKGISLHADIEPAVFDGYVDSEKFEHVLENLISNGVKYTPAGGRVSVIARRVGTDLSIEVTDTGVGIPAEHLPHLFERFYRVDASHHYEGTGIGLSLSKELVEMHHGRIQVKSPPGAGTCVTVTLPLSGYHPEEIVDRPIGEHRVVAGGTTRTAPSPEVAVEGRLVLIAEDNEDARAYLHTRLAVEFRVADATNGIEALAQARDNIPDVIVSDVMMPGLSGYELCAAIKQDERTSHIPVILLTALADKTDRIEGLQTGADDYLVKPFDAEELLVRVRNLIENRRRMQQHFRIPITLKPGEVQVASLDDRFLQKAMGVVDQNLGQEHFSVEQFADEAHFSRAQLHRKLKALTGLAPNEFIRHMRLMRARDLLAKNAGTISEIAYQVGFGSPSYFSQAFKEQFGMSPSEVRRE